MQKKRAERRGIALAVLIIGLGYFFYSHSERETTITVRDKEAITRGGGGRGYGTRERAWLIHTDDGIYEVSASVAFMRLDIVTPTRELVVGGTYRVSIAGWSVPFLGWHPNIIEVIGGPSL
jgi:hypothetical protein